MKNAMTFDDIYLLKDRAVQLILKEIDVMDLEYALMETTMEVKEAFFRNMSKRAEQMIMEDMQYNTNISRKDSLEAQQKILNVIFGLEKSGKIRLPEKWDRILHAGISVRDLCVLCNFMFDCCDAFTAQKLLLLKRTYKNSKEPSIVPEVLRPAIFIFRDLRSFEIWFIFLSSAKSQKVRTTWKSFKKEYSSRIPLKIWRSITAGIARKYFAAKADFEKKSYTDFCSPSFPLVSIKYVLSGLYL